MKRVTNVRKGYKIFSYDREMDKRGYKKKKIEMEKRLQT